MQADTFMDERMKILYALSFMRGGTAQVWAVNETMAVIMGTSQMQTLDIFLESVEKTSETRIGHRRLAHSFTSSKWHPALWPRTTWLDLKCLWAELALMMQHLKTYKFRVFPIRSCRRFSLR